MLTPILQPKSPENQSISLGAVTGQPPRGSDAGGPGRLGVQAPISCTPQIANNPVLAVGIDTLHASLRLDIPEDLLSKLEAAKKQVQETSESCECLQFGETKLFSWAIQRAGKKLFPYILKTGDITLCLSNRAIDSTIWNSRLEIGSMSSNDNLDELFSSLKKWLKHHGVKWEQDQVSRADLFVDIETDIKETGIEKQDHHVTRATTCGIYYAHRELTGVQIGKSSIMLRVYDKMQEMKEKRSTEKAMFFFEKWGKTPENVTRVEFQLRREAIVELVPGATDWKSIKPALPGVFEYLTEWFRHTQESVVELRKNNHQHTAEKSEFWKQVEQSVELWKEKFGEICHVDRKRHLKHFNMQPLIDQAAGCLLSVVAAMGHAHDDIFGMFSTVQGLVTDRLLEIMDRSNYEKQYYARAAMGQVTF